MMDIVFRIVKETLRFSMSAPQSPPDLNQRRAIAQDTISRSEAIVRDHAAEGATLDSSFLTLDQLPRMDASACPNLPPCGITVVNADSFTAARDIMQEAPEASGKTAVLNLASDEEPGGGWVISLWKTQVRFSNPCSCVYILPRITLGGSPLLFLDTLCHAQTRILSMAKRRSGFCRRDLFPGRRHL
jgi:hypothetical protein